jgi:tRNA pseudouridine32 synthase / 23S rRNA pseudouridine746 synthase
MNYPSEAPGALPLVHIDPWLLVADKPAGLLSVPGRGEDKQDCAAARARREVTDALVVHRLDMATSGLLLMARGAAMQRALSGLFESRAVRKRYVAVVAGRVPPPAGADGWGEIDLPLMTDWPNRPRQVVDHAGGKASRTRWRILAVDAARDATRLELEPLTGRSHQLRVHLQALGHPILGDPLYASQTVQAQSARLLLHASELALTHPATGEPMHWRSAAPF